MYRDTDPEVRDAYRETARGIGREQEREQFIDARYRINLSALASFPMQRTTAYWSIVPVAPLMSDLVAWVNETADDPDATLAAALANPAIAGKALREKYALARAEAQAMERERQPGFDWMDAALEQRAWERGGMV